MAAPAVYLALAGELRSASTSALRKAGYEVAGAAESVAEARHDPAFLKAGVLLYDARRTNEQEVDAAARQPYDGTPLPDGRLVIAALEPTDGPALPMPGVEQRFLFLPPSDPDVWARTVRNALAAKSFDPFRVIAIASPYGAAGKTTVTINLAAMLQFKFGISTIVLDFACEGPLLRHLLPERWDPSLLHVAQAHRRQLAALEDLMQESWFQLQGPSGTKPLRLLLAPSIAEQFSEADEDGRLFLDLDFHRDIVAVAKRIADVVLIDSSQDRWQPGNRTALASADLVLCPVEPGLTYMREWPIQMPSFLNAITNGGRQNRAWIRLLPNKVQPSLHRAGLALLASMHLATIGEIPLLMQEYARPFEQLPPRIPVLANPRGQVARIFRQLATVVAQGHVARSRGGRGAAA